MPAWYIFLDYWQDLWQQWNHFLSLCCRPKARLSAFHSFLCTYLSVKLTLDEMYFDHKKVHLYKLPSLLPEASNCTQGWCSLPSSNSGYFPFRKKKNPTPKNLIPILSRKELPEDYKLHSHFKGFWANLDEIPDLNTLLWKGSIQQLTSLAPLCLWTWSLKNGSGGIQWRGSCLHSISLEMTLSRSVPNPCVHSFKLNFSGCGIFLHFLPWMGVDMLLNSCLALLRR